MKGTANEGITFGKIDDEIIAYCGSDYAGDLDTSTRRSTAAYLFTLYGGAISWKSKQLQLALWRLNTWQLEQQSRSFGIEEDARRLQH